MSDAISSPSIAREPSAWLSVGMFSIVRLPVE